jgi:hypothetical protein
MEKIEQKKIANPEDAKTNPLTSVLLSAYISQAKRL